MPDAETLAAMYGPAYAEFLSSEASHSGAEGSQAVIRWLDSLRPGAFLDYGCGGGQLLKEARRHGWEAVGVEFDAGAAARASQTSGARVVTDTTVLGDSFRADLLHLGDVIEHLTDPDTEIPEILSLLKPGGVLLAQGPLENNPNLFWAVTRWGRRLRGRPRVEMAPYHVLLATAAGQRAFFRRFGLQEFSFTLREAAWPAPNRISVSDLGRPRRLGLFLIRRFSQLVSRLAPHAWGNRYFYAGHWKP
jgi:SAM-dependent methyltransferase